MGRRHRATSEAVAKLVDALQDLAIIEAANDGEKRPPCPAALDKADDCARLAYDLGDTIFRQYSQP